MNEEKKVFRLYYTNPLIKDRDLESFIPPDLNGEERFITKDGEIGMRLLCKDFNSKQEAEEWHRQNLKEMLDVP